MSKWVCTWGVSTSYVKEDIRNLIEDTTVRYVFYNMLDGNKFRLHFSNILGHHDGEITEAYIAEWGGKDSGVVSGTSKKVTFTQNGNVVKAGQELFSDDIEYNMESGKSYAVSLYFEKIIRVECGYSRFFVMNGASFNQGYHARGNHASDDVFPITGVNTTSNYIYFCGVDVLTGDNSSAIMAFGDSITGRPWPDFFSRRITEMGIRNRSVVRKAIGGNRVLHDYEGISSLRSRGISCIRRIERELDQTTGVDTVIMLEGINDLCHPKPDSKHCPMSEYPTVDELIEGYKFCCEAVHRKGAKFYLGTILPTPLTLADEYDREERRKKVNEWIRNNDIADGVIDFDAVMKDENDPCRMKSEYDCGDGLHPNALGSQALANAIPEYIIYNK